MHVQKVKKLTGFDTTKMYGTRLRFMWKLQRYNYRYHWYILDKDWANWASESFLIPNRAELIDNSKWVSISQSRINIRICKCTEYLPTTRIVEKLMLFMNICKFHGGRYSELWKAYEIEIRFLFRYKTERIACLRFTWTLAWRFDGRRIN